MSPLGDTESLQREALSELDQILAASPEQRHEHLERIARVRPDLHALLVQLLKYETTVERGFMEPAAAAGLLGPDRRLGPYRILRLLGEGGMGEVWLAKRDDGLYEGQVAIKTLHAYFAGGALRELFLREAQVLGRLAHPNIAKLLDAGIHEGVVYLVLEYVVGQPLDQACDEQRLGVEARLEIFLKLCAAVAHAHASLVIHRDIKPGNVLLTTGSLPKLLDFGIASFYEPDHGGLPTDVTRQTGRTFTPEYAAPEQVLGQEITTATDVYALGVLLQVLLTGKLPYGEIGRGAAPLQDAVLRQEPMPLSRAIDGDDCDTLAEKRSATCARLRRELSGDLENIVLKALKKLPQERYPTVAALADDIRRYLQGEPVQARADSAWYRLGKFARRNRVAVGASIAIVLALGAGLAVSLWQLQVARAERRHANEVKDFVADIFRSADPYFTGKSDMSAAELLTLAHARVDAELKSKPEVAAELLNVVGESQLNLEQNQAAEVTIRKALDIAQRLSPPDEVQSAEARVILANVESQKSNKAEAVKLLEQALPVLRRHRPDTSRQYAAALVHLASIDSDEGRGQLAIDRAREAVSVLESAFGRMHSETILCNRNLALFLVLARQYDEARPILEQGLVDARAISSPGERLALMQSLESTYARLLLDSGDLAGGTRHIAVAVDLAIKAWGPNSNWAAVARSQLSRSQARLGDMNAAIATSQQSFDVTPPGETSARLLTNTGRYMLMARKLPEALEVLRKAVELESQHDHGIGSWLPAARTEYGTALALMGRFAEADQILQANLPAARESGVPGLLPGALNAIGISLQLQSRWRESEPYFREALTLTTGKELVQKPRPEALGGLGLIELESGQAAAAEPLFRQADEFARITFVNFIPLRAALSMHLGRALLAQGKVAEARESLGKAHAYWQGFDARRREAGEAAYWMAQGHLAAAEHKQARAEFARAVQVLRESPLPGDARLVAEARRQLALMPKLLRESS
jgi:eukaryotic-like serine/threonine-protein kinase